MNTRQRIALSIVLTVTIGAGTICLFTIKEHKSRTEKAEQRTQFITAVNKAFEAKSPEALLALCCWDNVNEQERERTSKMLVGFFNPAFAPNGPRVSYKPVSIRKEAAPSWFSGNSFTRNGIKYRPNLLEVGEVRVGGRNGAPSGGEFVFVLAVGEKDGRLWFIGNAQAL